MTDEQRLFACAKRYLGTSEVPGKASNPIIQKWIYRCASWLDQDDSKTAWCGCFRAAIGDEAGTAIVAAPYRAINWARWGVSVMELPSCRWPQGATVTMSRKGGHHVALLDRVEGGTAYILGGNQNDCASIIGVPVNRLNSVRISHG